MSFREVTTLAHSHQLALTDELTGLGNRRAFYEQVAVAARGLPDSTGALLLLDLDRFKEVNDSLGHHAGRRPALRRSPTGLPSCAARARTTCWPGSAATSSPSSC